MKRLLLSLLISSLTLGALAQVPKTLSFQGYLIDQATGDPLTANPDMTFSLWDALSGGNQKWVEIHSAVPVNKGLYNVLLGDAGTPIDLPFNVVYYLQVKVGLETLTPRITVSSSAYSLSSLNASNIAGGTLSGSLVGTGVNATNITTGAIANTLLDSDLQDLADGALSGSLVGSGINATNITTGTLSGGLVGSGINAANISSGTIADARLETTVDINTLNVGSAGQFALSSTGNITKLNNVAYSFPSSQGAVNSFLANNGAGTLSWATGIAGSQVGSGISASNITSGTMSGTLVGSGISAANITGSLPGTQVGTGIDGGNLTVGTVADARLETTLDRTAFNASGNIASGGYLTSVGGVHVGSSSAPGAGNLEIDGFTKMGNAIPGGADASASVPVIKNLKLSGTTSANVSGTTGVNHGLTVGKILSVSVLVQYSAGNFVGPGFIFGAGYYFNCYLTPSQIVVANVDTSNPLFSSTTIRGKTFVVYITYEQ